MQIELILRFSFARTVPQGRHISLRTGIQFTLSVASGSKLHEIARTPTYTLLEFADMQEEVIQRDQGKKDAHSSTGRGDVAAPAGTSTTASIIQWIILTSHKAH
jgi:hypothetical protein